MPKRIDGNHREIVSLFRVMGCDVDDTHDLPRFVDCVIGYRGLTALIEIKDGKGKLKDHQQARENEYRGLFAVVRDAQDVENLLCQMNIWSERINGETETFAQQ